MAVRFFLRIKFYCEACRCFILVTIAEMNITIPKNMKLMKIVIAPV